LRLVCCVIGLPVGFGTSAAVATEPLKWSVTPYVWAVETKLDMTAGDDQVGDNLSFSDLLDTLDSAFQIHVEAGRGRWSGFADVTYIEASDSDGADGDLRIVTDSEQWHPMSSVRTTRSVSVSRRWLPCRGDFRMTGRGPDRGEMR